MSTLAALDSPRTLIDELLQEQQQLSAVERFAQRYPTGGGHAHAPYYRQLIPLSRPGPGEQYAFAVELDACTGCKACVSACHSLNGLEEGEIWRNVGLIHGGSAGAPYQQAVTTACHHCLEPGCLEGCPVMAYEKDPQTGIVRHLDDQCIGCQYCLLKCPYDVPKYSKTKGIVRKCDMCSNRLSAGEAPACVQACPTSAIRIEIVQSAALLAQLAPGSRLVPGAFDSSYTQPTTQYRARRPIPATAQPADANTLRLEDAHWPLALMLVLTQAAAGLLLAGATAALLAGSEEFAALRAVLAGAAFLVLQGGLGVSVLHLGRPLGAWRFFLGLRTSWMSREILAFGLLAAASGAAAVATIVSWAGAAWDWPMARAFGVLAGPACGAAAICGIGGVFCSAMIYIDTRRPWWAASRTLPSFFGATLLLGAAAASSLLALAPAMQIQIPAGAIPISAALTLALRGSLALWDGVSFWNALSDRAHAQHPSARVIWKLKRPCAWAWLGFVLAAGFASLLAIVSSGLPAAAAAVLAFVLNLAAQALERHLYFVAVVAPRMPGGVPL